MDFIYDLKLTSTPFLKSQEHSTSLFIPPSSLLLCRRHREPEYISLHYTPGLSADADLISVAKRCKQCVLTLF